MTLSSVNTIWVLLGAAMVFFMQAGFSLCEAGFTRAKNTGNILMKNLMDFCIGTPCFWLFGFGIMFGAGSAVVGWLDPGITKDYSFITRPAFLCGRLPFSRPYSARPLPPSFPAPWQSVPSSARTAFILPVFPCLSTPSPDTGSGAAAG